jgi:hypothetical protein
MTNFAEKIRPRIVFDLTIHRENFYRVDLINLTFHFDINFFAEKPLVVFSLSGLFFHSTRCFFTINQFDWSKFEKCCNLIGYKFSSWIVRQKNVFHYCYYKNLLHSLGLAYKSMRGMMTNSIDRDQWLNVTSESRDRI